MSNPLKLSLLLLGGIVLTLTACNDISNDLDPTVTSTSSAPQVARESPSRQRSQSFNQNNQSAQAQNDRADANRRDYNPIALSEMADGDNLRGSDPKAIALSTFGDTESEAAPPSETAAQTVTVDYPQGNQAIVMITQTQLPDDSVGSIRYRVEFRQNSSAEADQQWEMVWAGSQVKCQPGRGHQDWSAELCL